MRKVKLLLMTQCIRSCSDQRCHIEVHFMEGSASSVAMPACLEQLQGGGVGRGPPNAPLLKSLQCRVLLQTFHVFPAPEQREFSRHSESALVLTLSDTFVTPCSM